MAGKRVCRVILEEAERRELKEVVYGTSSKERRKRAHILVLADQGEFNERQYTDEEIAEITDSNPSTVERLRKRCVLDGLERALERKEQANRKARSLDGAAEARLVATGCGEPPEGVARWTMKLLAARLVELEIVDSISEETVRQTLKKTASNRGRRSITASRQRKAVSS